MTPAIDLAKTKNISHTIHEYEHDPRAESYGLEAVEALGHDPSHVYKTLLFSLNGDAKSLAVAVIPVEQKLNLKLAAKAAKAKKAEMANPDLAQKSTGYVVGGISPLGQKKPLPTYIHHTAKNKTTICVSAGRRGLEIELAPQDLALLTKGQFAELCL
ncbi:Cys-tRNA(Pro)/Cys-tRNA(Cys) deacylase [Vibrio zhanjiangensis]|uniref:Cys-tRNA(Pro)/Cys-tRNA(Cys) deacylase n=1 Tax=Vibrio zhanjiangensis TaxID=1046128 RepID=A0ABQ6EUP6_9VIBR|nr:Cys-tRNA(Pro) deacylase [Vibrio zhanjiangensis]GLT16704.1 Cys-tRNA(Pro)/Cys-tRNA(Cys) deacylase [Vibrio zhanjiangensis]